MTADINIQNHLKEYRDALNEKYGEVKPKTTEEPVVEKGSKA